VVIGIRKCASEDYERAVHRRIFDSKNSRNMKVLCYGDIVNLGDGDSYIISCLTEHPESTDKEAVYFYISRNETLYAACAGHRILGDVDDTIKQVSKEEFIIAQVMSS
jgi:CobQ-like glutamine amidotransferase family enzyme